MFDITVELAIHRCSCLKIWSHSILCTEDSKTTIDLPGDPKKSIPLFGVSGETQVFAKQLNRHIFG